MQQMKAENEFIDLFLKATKPPKRGKCLYPGCTDPAINSHAIAESILRRIAPQGTVLIWDPEPHTWVENARSGEDVERIYDKPRKIEIGKKATWPLFCKDHDHSVFRPLEDAKREVKPDDEQATLLAYRALCYKTYNPRLEEQLDLLLSLENGEKVAENMRLFAVKPLRDARERVGNMVVAKAYTLKWEAILVPIAPCVACTDAFIQIAEDEDVSIQGGNVTLSADDVMTFTIFPKNQDETLCVITWFEGSKRGVEYVTSLKLRSQNDQDQFPRDTAFTTPGIFISEAWWESLSNEVQQYLKGLQLANALATRNLQKQ
jgi:hypothetical protein